jgi:Flp pilus assembly protein CpaB
MRQWVRLIFIGLSVALIASALARMLQPESAARPRTVAVDVVVAARDIDVGHVLVAEDLATERVADGPKARTGVAMAAAAVGRTASTAIRKGQLVREEDLASPGQGASLASLVPPGQRAVTVALREPGPGPALFPGAFVDVLVTADIPSRASGFRDAMTKTLIERSRVLAVNDQGIGVKAAAAGDARERRGGASRAPTITLLVTREQAEQLELASVRGTLGIALCAAGDVAAGGTPPPGITTSGMLGIEFEPEPAPVTPAAEQPKPEPVEPPSSEPSEPAPTPEPAKPEVWEVVVIRGDATVKHPFTVKPATPPGPEAPGTAAEPKR